MRVLSALVLAGVLATPGSAATFSGEVAVAGAFADPGLVIGVAPAPSFSAPDLRPGESYRFDAFRLWTDVASVRFDDRLAQPISARFTFADLGIEGVVTGKTVGEVERSVQQGRLTWDAPLVLRFGPGQSGQFTLALSDALFNKGFRRLSGGAQNGAVVSATLAYDLAPTTVTPVAVTPTVAPIPLPAALPLLLGAIGLLGATARRRQG